MMLNVLSEQVSLKNTKFKLYVFDTNVLRTILIHDAFVSSDGQWISRKHTPSSMWRGKFVFL